MCSFESHNTCINEAELIKRVKQGEVDPQIDINELDFDDPMRPGIFAGARRFNSSKVHECQLCGWEGHSPSYFAAIDAQGLQAHEQMQTTYEYMVSQISDKFDFLKNYTKSEIVQLKKEIQQVMDGNSTEIRSELRAQVDRTLEEFRAQANGGRLTREYKDAVEVIIVCAGCCGLTHGKEYWQWCPIEDINGVQIEGYKLTSEWRNQFKLCHIKVEGATTNRCIKKEHYDI